jgi:hypothetical protein
MTLGTTETSATEQGEQNANSAASTQDGSNSFDPKKFASDLEKRLAAQYSPENLESLVQKHAHKGLDRLEKQVGAVQDTLSEFKALKAEGLTDAQAEQEMRLRRIEQSVSQPTATQPTAGSREEDKTNDLALGMLKGLGLSDTDTEVQKALLANANDPAGLTTSLVAIYENRKNQPAPNPGTIAQSTAGTTTTTLTAEQIEHKAAELDKLLIEPTKNKAAIVALQKELGPDYQ